MFSESIRTEQRLRANVHHRRETLNHEPDHLRSVARDPFAPLLIVGARGSILAAGDDEDDDDEEEDDPLHSLAEI